MRSLITKTLCMILLFLLVLNVACAKSNDDVKETETDQIEDAETPSSEKNTAAEADATESSIEQTESETQTTPDDTTVLSRFSGTPISKEENQKRPLAVMIDNHPNARMQAGFRNADMVFEMVVEGSYTRYMMIFHSQDAELVGPIRSARKYYIDRMSEFDAIYTHFGGSKEANLFLKDKDDIDGMVVPSSVIWRYNDTGKSAPHNAYSNTKKLREYAIEKGSVNTTEKPGFNFYDTARDIAGEPANKVHVSYFAANQSIFTYDPATGFYSYNKDGEDQVDENDQKPLEISNIIIQVANYYPNPDYKGILTLDQVGKGEGYFVTRGKYVPITWEKADQDSQTKYYFDGREITLNPGQTWVLLAQDQDRTDIEFTE